jgi:hypothetical protein
MRIKSYIKRSIRFWIKEAKLIFGAWVMVLTIDSTHIRRGYGHHY